MDVDELALDAGMRETREETGLSLPSLMHIATCDIQGDECRRGAEMHRWHIFAAHTLPGASITINPQEGVSPVWLSLNEARHRPLTPAVKYIIKHFARRLA